jgi:hypothetical protein
LSVEKTSFADVLFGKEGYYSKMLPDPQVRSISALMKATTPLTYSASTTWFDPVYLGNVYLEALTRSTKAFKALRKTTYQQEGDSLQYITSDSHEGLGAILESGALYSAYTNPALADIDSIYPAIVKYDWVNTEVAAQLSQIQKSRRTPTLEQLRDYTTRKFWDAVDMMLCGVYVDFAAGGNGTNQGGYGADAPATNGANVALIESICRMITDATESADGDVHLSAGTDGDVYWNSTGVAGTARFDRSAGAGVATLRCPTTAGTEEAYNICDELDDLMAKCLVYADEPYNYIAMMSPKAYNKVKAENDPKALITDYSGAVQSINGISSTPGVVGGKVQLSALRLSDITVPIATAPYLMGTNSSSWLWMNSNYTTGGVGDIYLINQDNMEFRTLIPFSYRSIPAEDSLQTKHTLYMAGQLIAKNYKSHGALKYIAA